MKKLLYILLFVPFTFLGQSIISIEQDSPLFLPEGWSIFGYSCYESQEVIAAFEPVVDKIIIVKDYSGAVYIPEFGFNGIGSLERNRGYQIKLTGVITDFQFCPFLVPLVEGCMNETAFNYNSNANMEDGSCIIYGCTNPYSQGGLYNPLANVDDGSCILIGCADSMYVEYYNQGFTPTISEEVYNDLFCSQIAIFGCTDNGWLPNALGEINDSDLDMNPAVNYNPDANIDDGSCITEIMGCIDSLACNFNPGANMMSNGSCIYAQQGYDCDGNITEYFVGVQAEGGIIFYIDETGQHGLVAAMEDLTEGSIIDSEGNPGYQWGCFATGISGADGQAIGTGYQNTLEIASGCSETPIAASEALAYESDDYSDWYLPSLNELNEMYNTIGTAGLEGNIGGFSSNWYWSSSESNNYGAYDVNFGDGSTGNFSSKTKIVRVRVIRAF